MAKGRIAEGRVVLRVAGDEAAEFLHGLVSGDVEGLAAGQAGYAALLTPQGKYIADFLVLRLDGAVLLDMEAALAPALAQRLTMYRLRRKLEIGDAGLQVLQLWGEGAEDAAARAAGTGAAMAADPRDPALGFRVWSADAAAALAASGAEEAAAGDWDALRVAHAIPEYGSELGPDAYILEYGFERLGGVDFKKGCYVGQEIVARMKHRQDLRRKLLRVKVDGPVPAPGTEVLDENGKPAGALGAVVAGEGLAHLRLDRAEGVLTAGEATVSVIG